MTMCVASGWRPQSLVAHVDHGVRLESWLGNNRPESEPVYRRRRRRLWSTQCSFVRCCCHYFIHNCFILSSARHCMCIKSYLLLDEASTATVRR